MKKLLVALLSAVLVASALGRDIPQLSHPTAPSELFVFAIEAGGFAEMCENTPYHCPMPKISIDGSIDDYAYGIFNPFEKANTVVMSESLLEPGTVMWNAVLVHEMTHYLQYLRGEFVPSKLGCAAHERTEHEAYDVGAKYLQSLGFKEDFAKEKAQMSLDAAMCLMSGGG